jgi:hypothetical protein
LKKGFKMNMYDSDGNKIGTKSFNSATSTHTMNFAPRVKPVQQQTQMQSQQPNNFSFYKQRAQTPTIQYEQPTDGMSRTENHSRIIRNLAAKKNFESMQAYDKLNAASYSQQQDRLNRELISDRDISFRREKMQNDNVNFQIEQDARNLQYQRQAALKNVMTPYQQQQIQTRQVANRAKNFDDEAFRAMLPKEVNDGNLDDRDYQIAKQKYLETGKLPEFQKYDGGSWFSDDYRIAQAPTAGANQPQTPQANQQKEETPEERAYKRYVMQKHNQIMQ